MNPTSSPTVSFRTSLKHGLLLLVALGVLLTVVYFCTEAMFVRKLLIRLVVPTGLCWLALLATTYFLFLNKQRYAGVACLLITVLYTLAGNSMIAQSLATSLEKPYQDFDVQDADSYDAIVLLGGGTMMGFNAHPQLGQSGDRVMVTLHMFVAGKARKIVCTGSQALSANSGQGMSPGEQGQAILSRAGVSTDKIELIQGRNTSEEIRNLSRRFQNTNLKIAVVSSAWHLPRVMRLCKQYGFQADPIPANFVSKTQKPGLMTLVPSAGNLVISGMLLKERLAQLLGQ